MACQAAVTSNAAMMEAGNLYSAALPAWIAAGFEEAVASGRELEGHEMLVMGYGSGDAAEAIPARVASGWKAAAAKIGLARALSGAVDLDQAQYEALHDGLAAPGLEPAAKGFLIERVGGRSSGSVQDFGVSYYRYLAADSAIG